MSHYATLGVDENASPEEIKKAYRRLAMKWHPDRNIGGDHKGAEAKFKAIQVAYDILSDASKRIDYDSSIRRSQSWPFSSGSSHRTNQQHDFGHNFDYEAWAAEVRARQRRYAPPPTLGEDVESEISLTIEEACLGGEFSATLEGSAVCGACNGTGVGIDIECPSCKGDGWKEWKNGSVHPCRKCGGYGTVSPPCKTCKGEKTVSGKRKIKLKVGGGLAEGDRIRIRGAGGKGANGGEDGNAYFTVHIKDHPLYERDGIDLYSNVVVDFVTAILGGSVQVASPWGMRKLVVPPMTRANKMFRIVGAGMRRMADKAEGNLYVRTSIDLLPGMEKYQLSAESELALLVMRRMAEDDRKASSGGC